MMNFNLDKCEAITITNKRKPIIAEYKIHGQILKRVKNTKYLGVTIDHKLSWNTHIDNITKKANSTRAFLQRNTKSCPVNIKAKCYTTYVRPTLEYASTVWDPHTAKSRAKLEAVQRRSARYVFSDFDRYHSVTAMLTRLKWDSLQACRQHAKSVMMYRIVNSLVAIPHDQYLMRSQSSTRGHNWRFLVPHTRVLAYKHSFFPSAIRIWNGLHQEVITKPTLDCFKIAMSSCNPGV